MALALLIAACGFPAEAPPEPSRRLVISMAQDTIGCYCYGPACNAAAPRGTLVRVDAGPFRNLTVEQERSLVASMEIRRETRRRAELHGAGTRVTLHAVSHGTWRDEKGRVYVAGVFALGPMPASADFTVTASIKDVSVPDQRSLVARPLHLGTRTRHSWSQTCMEAAAILYDVYPECPRRAADQAEELLARVESRGWGSEDERIAAWVAILRIAHGRGETQRASEAAAALREVTGLEPERHELLRRDGISADCE